MPRIQPFGHRYAASFGGFSQLTLGSPTEPPRAVLHPASGDWWLNDREIVTFTTELVAYDIHTRATRPVLPGVTDLTWFAAGGGRIAVWSQSRGPLLDGEPIQAVPVGFGPDGTFAWRDWGSNAGITLTPPSERPGSARDVRITDALYVDPQIFDFGRVFWQEGTRLRGRGIDTSRWQTRPGGFGWSRAAQIAGRWYLVYQSYGMAAVVLHAADDASRGFSWPAPLAYRIDLTDVDGRAFVVWSVVDRDWPEDIRTKLVDPAEARPFAEPEPEPEDPVGLPDDNVAVQIVNEERARFTGVMSDTDLVNYQRRVAGRLNGKGYGPLGLLKKGGRNCGGYSCDVIGMAIPGGQAQWDVMQNHDNPAEPNFQKATWGRVANVTVRELEIVPAISDGNTPPPPPPDGIEPGEKHPYIRDDEERDECDVRFTDGSQCDQPKGAEIHQVAPKPDPEPKPEPQPEPQPGDDVLLLILAELRKLTRHLGA